ncbi:hypothetical protein HHI36_001017 [Cryptolaemus montrouzieri]|uniref:Uncharacterized protein n=1 Tax=Cryptolaemus montrouzieri TaxID=559131 RepID=A0ABD2P709_9CUCU
MYDIPYKNLSIPQLTSFALEKNEEMKRETTTLHQIEDFYITRQEDLVLPLKCPKALLKELKEECPRIRKPRTPDLYQLEDKIIISQNNTWIFETCENITKRIKIPMISRLRSTCIISNGRKQIYTQVTLTLKQTIDLRRGTVSGRSPAVTRFILLGTPSNNYSFHYHISSNNLYNCSLRRGKNPIQGPTPLVQILQEERNYMIQINHLTKEINQLHIPDVIPSAYFIVILQFSIIEIHK